MLILTQFVFRLSFGLALAMGLTSPRKVTSGYFRNHSYVLLGVNVLAILAALADSKHLSYWPPLIGAGLSYFCSVAWLYEKPRAGTPLLLLIAAVAFYGAWAAQQLPFMSAHAHPMPWAHVIVSNANATPELIPLVMWRADGFTSGLLLGSTMAAMFLGHWYLNSPTMEIAPLRKLLQLMAVAVLLQGVLSAIALGVELQLPWLESTQYPLIALRWIAGLFGTGALVAMAWQTLKIPNTQSATGILYVAVLTTFLGELTSLLLSRNTAYPL